MHTQVPPAGHCRAVAVRRSSTDCHQGHTPQLHREDSVPLHRCVSKLACGKQSTRCACILVSPPLPPSLPAAVVTKLVQRGYQSHLEDFALRLNYNGFYAAT